MRSEFDIKVQWIAFPLHPETPPEGRTLEELFAGRNVNIPQMIARLKKTAGDLGLPFGDRKKTYNSRLAQELGKWAEKKGSGDAFHDAVFRAYFVDGRNIADKDTLGDVAHSAGLNTNEALKVLADRTFKAAVDSDWSRAYESKVTAVPTFLITGHSLVGAQSYNVLANFIQQSGTKQRV